MNDVKIIAGSAADLPSVMPVMSSAFAARFGEAWTQAQCLGVLSMPGSHLAIAQDAAPLGFALSRIVIDECELMLLAVIPEAQSRKIGRALLHTVIENARAGNARCIFLEVRERNSAIRLYSSAGFVEVGRRRGYYRGRDGETFDALTYRLALI